MKTDLELRHLRVLAAVVEAGSYTRAARTLGVSQSTVSETLAALERRLGAALFTRSAKGPTPTLAGRLVLGYSRKILAMTGELAAELAGVSNAVVATLVVGAVESVSAYLLPGALAMMRRRWPKARVEVITATCLEIRERVTAGAYDLGLLLEADDGAACDSILMRTRLVVFGTAAHPLAGQRATPDELRRCDFHMCDAAGTYHQLLRRHFEGSEVPAPRTQAIGSVEGVKRSVAAATTALGLLPAHTIAAELRDGSLVEVALSPRLPALVMRAVGNLASAMVAELIDHLRRVTGSAAR